MSATADRAPRFDLAELRRRAGNGDAWRSLEELAGTPAFTAFVEAEFPRWADHLRHAPDRRTVLRLMGAALAMGGLAACSPAEKIVPYVRQPENVVPGRALHFATTLSLDGFGIGALVESHTGRPTKVEGNPDHPASLGASNAVMQAACLSLYDPGRSQSPLRDGAPTSWDAVLGRFDAIRRDAARDEGASLAILTDTVTSPTIVGQLERLRSVFPRARIFRHDPVAGTDAVIPGAVNDRSLRAVPRLGSARVVLSLDADFLGDGPGQLAHARGFAERRIVRDGGDQMLRLHAIESTPTITGAAADHRWAVPASAVETVGRAVAARLGVGAAPPTVPIPDAVAAAIAGDLAAAGPEALVIAGPAQPGAVHFLAAAINVELGSVGRTVDFIPPPEMRTGIDGDLGDLVAAIDAGSVGVLVILGGDPVFTAPGDVAFAPALRTVPVSVHLGLRVDQTASLCGWHLPLAHELESWGDLRAFDGTASLVQPLILPLHGGRSCPEVLAMLLGSTERHGLDIVRAHWRAAGLGDEAWTEALRTGVVAGTAAVPEAVGPIALPPAHQDGAAPVDGTVEVRFVPDPWLRAGIHAGNAWLQELPRPLTKIVWGNAGLMAPVTADRLGLADGDMIALARDGRSATLPVAIVPGHPEDAVTLSLGHGAGGLDAHGFDVSPLRAAATPWILPSVVLKPTGAHRPVITTQHHHAMEGRDLVRRMSLADYRADPGRLGEDRRDEQPSLYPEWTYPDEAWGMVVDLSACIGCMACVAACQAENNIPTVGAEECARGHEMHWLRVDRYYAGDPADPETLFQPVPCMHCEKAPCELVCPVNATVHTHDGLNAQIYNRCIGTRYCSQNCPYKVRRFNFLEYQPFDEGSAAPTAPLMNPDVSVRSRGVMEKCTYCVQRISRARIDAEVAGRPLADGDVVTACQQACPTRAIVFGDLNDAGSAVRRLRDHPLDYTLLAELNTRPRTTYLARVTNPNPALADGGGEAGHG